MAVPCTKALDSASEVCPSCFRIHGERDSAADEYAADLTTPVPCPMACGRATEDPYGGPCRACWDQAPGPWTDEDGASPWMP